MSYSNQLENVSILGAAGKMGSGITLLMALEMADQALKPENKDQSFVLNAIDVSEDNLKGLLSYIENQAVKSASKKVEELSLIFGESLSESEIAQRYAQHVLGLLKPFTSHEAAFNSTVIFEAIIENEQIKTEIFSKINQANSRKPWIFSNTSSIPIGKLNKTAALEGRILGFHFYNPPAVQKLVELITISENPREMVDFAVTLAKRLRKVVVHSNDIAGFIGNGHFMRDALHGISEAEKLAETMPLHEAVNIVNKTSQDLLVRPMGIFQLIDYVGIDVVRFIMHVMSTHLGETTLRSELLDQLFNAGVKGGQFSDGSQKEGFFRYEKGKPVAVYSAETADYIPLADLSVHTDKFLGELPPSLQPWKVINFSPEKQELLKTYFDQLKQLKSNGAVLALNYLRKSMEIGKNLVSDGVANSYEDVNTVLMTGFFHAYGPVNQYAE